MATSADKDNNNTEMMEEIPLDDDDQTDQTATTHPKIDNIGEEMTEYTLRYEIPYNKGQANKNDFKKHVKLLVTLTEALDITELRIINNKNKRVKSLEDAKWLDQEYYKSHFNVHSDDIQRKTVIVH
jgi:hypothetical protein